MAEGKAMNSALLELYRHKTWATLRHLVDAEEGYFSILTRERFRTKEAAAAFIQADRLPDGPLPLDQLAERIRGLGSRWETLAQDADLPGREVTTTDGWRLPGAVLLAQAIHHADDHRSHVLSILGALGLEVPELDVWTYAWSTGEMQELPATPAET